MSITFYPRLWNIELSFAGRKRKKDAWQLFYLKNAARTREKRDSKDPVNAFNLNHKFCNKQSYLSFRGNFIFWSRQFAKASSAVEIKKTFEAVSDDFFH